MSENPLTTTSSPSNAYERLRFFGQGSTYFGIVALNVVLTVLTLGLYYPWAKAAYRKYFWNEVEFKDSRFVFNGTGKEMFKGFVIAYIIFIGFYALMAMTALYTYGWVFLLLFYVFLLLLMPFAIFGAWRYRVSRTSWRGIFLEFDGHLREFIKLFLIQLFFTVITLGIYSSWMSIKIRKYLFGHTKIGDIRLGFEGGGGDYFGINLAGIILSYLTFFIYFPFYIKNVFTFSIENTTMTSPQMKRYLNTDITGGTVWKTLVVNGLILLLTLGLAFPWTFMRKMRMFLNHTLIPTDFDFDNLSQSSTNYKNATGDEMSDILDLDFDF